jgi:broad specificity phosphatase PhoE
MSQRWPQILWVVRHGESQGNVARSAASAAGSTHIETLGRDADVPLSELGERQAIALGRWFATLPPEGRPQVILSSPYARACRTAQLIREHGHLEVEPCDFMLDERLREREFGVLDRLTTQGIRTLQPEQAEHRRILGKFYHRPPGGESWCDVILRLRSAMESVALHHSGARVLIVAHQVVVLCLRYLVENMTEAEILAVDRAEDVPNCGVAEYVHDPAKGRGGQLALRRWNWVAPLEEQGAPVTAEPELVTGVR